MNAGRASGGSLREAGGLEGVGEPVHRLHNRSINSQIGLVGEGDYELAGVWP